MYKMFFLSNLKAFSMMYVKFELFSNRAGPSLGYPGAPAALYKFKDNSLKTFSFLDFLVDHVTKKVAN